MPAYWSDMRNKPTCVYRVYDVAGRLLYVGMTKNPRGRFAQHNARPWWPDADVIYLAWFPNRTEALNAERHAIRDESPIHNRTRPRVERC
jgi:predicted GIY-YIG superfamily endonuclease